MSAAVIVPTLNADAGWPGWIDALLAAGVNTDDVYVIDSGSTDQTVDLSRSAGFKVHTIEPLTFDHGGTRQLAVESLGHYDFAVFLTQDAILCNTNSIRNIIAPFSDKKIGAVCGRQLPALNAGLIESHARIFNYPERSLVHSIHDINAHGLKSIFLSNSFAAYRISALNEVGGFPENVIFGEDMYVAAKLLKANWKVAYAADACVYHSHNYTLVQEIKRYFDMGVFHSREPWIRNEFGNAEKEGVKFVRSEIRYLLRHSFWRIPEALLRTVLKYTGFRLGLAENRLPVTIRKKLSMNPVYFDRNS